MGQSLQSQPSATAFDVEELVDMAWNGQIRVPHFQRDFRWNILDVQKLFDSIVQGYPIGSLLLWTRRAPAQRLKLGDLDIDAPESSNALWVVDGQQRLTSVANALHPSSQGHPRFALSYDLRVKGFVRSPAVSHALVIPLPVLFNLQQILKWFSDYPEISDHLDEATGITRRIRQFRVPAYLVTQDDPRVLQDIFDRMNNYGKRLSRAEIFSALNAGVESPSERPSTFESIADRIDADQYFGKIDNDTVLAAILARRGPDIRRDIRAEFTKPDDEGRDAAYEAGERALRAAVAFLQEEAGVPHLSLLAYKYLLVVLTRVFALHPDPDPRNRLLLRRWYWQAAVVGPENFKGGTPNAARVLCGQVVAESLTDSVQGLLRAVRKGSRQLPDLERFATNEAATKIVLCSWWALEPKMPITGQPFLLRDLAAAVGDHQTARGAVRYILPRGSLSVIERPWAANRLLLPDLDLDPHEIFAALTVKPIFMSDDEWTAVRASHLVDQHAGQLLEDVESEAFLAARQDRLAAHLNDFLERACEWSFEDTPPLSAFVIDEDE